MKKVVWKVIGQLLRGWRFHLLLKRPSICHRWMDRITVVDKMKAALKEHWSLPSATKINPEIIILHHRHSAHHPKKVRKNIFQSHSFYFTLFAEWKVTKWIGQCKNTQRPSDRLSVSLSDKHAPTSLCCCGDEPPRNPFTICVYYIDLYFYCADYYYCYECYYICQKLIEPSKARAFILPSLIHLALFKALRTIDSSTT